MKAMQGMPTQGIAGGPQTPMQINFGMNPNQSKKISLRVLLEMLPGVRLCSLQLADKFSLKVAYKCSLQNLAMKASLQIVDL